MSEYTFADLIINPETPNLKSLIGKEVYFNDVPTFCIRNANDDYMVGILTSVHIWESAPFYVETPGGLLLNYACIIPKKEESEKEESEPKYVPFENAEEFLDAYYHNETENLDGVYHYLATRGIWLKDKSTEVPAYCMATEVRDNGVIISDKKLSTTGILIFNNTTSWSELYESFTFLDGTPCGRLEESK